MSSKKTGKSNASETEYQVRDIVLAKIRGYPAWPAMIVNPEAVSKSVLKEKPMSKKTTFYCVRFFPAGDHAWAVAKDMSRLLTHEIESYLSEPSKKSGELKRGYEIALNPAEWEANLDAQKAEQDAAAEEEEEGVDQLDESDGGEEELDSNGEPKKKKKKAAAGGIKRKRESATAEELKKKRKSAQEALSAKRRPIAGSKRAGKAKKDSTENLESEDGGEDGEEGGDKKKRSGKKGKGGEVEDRGGKRPKKDKDDMEGPEDAALAGDANAQRAKEWRHKLQRAFLTPKSPPKPEDMPSHDQTFQTVETYDGWTIDYLQFSKIGKVMRRIAASEDIPRDDEFKFKDRANVLVQKWQAIITQADQDATVSTHTNGQVGDDANKKPKSTAKEVNGDSKADDATAEESEKKEEASMEAAGEAMDMSD